MADKNVFVLFEELKSMLKGITNRLEELPKVLNVQQLVGDNKQDLSPIKDMIAGTAKAQSERIKGLLATQWEAYAQVSNVILKRIGVLNETIGYLKEHKQDTQAQPQEHIHRHSFDIKSSKVFFFVAGIGTVCIISLWGNVELWESKRQYKDDALKFRFIRANRGCTSKDILWLNEVFDIHRSQSDINRIEEQVGHYNSLLKATSDSLMQVKLQENTKTK